MQGNKNLSWFEQHSRITITFITVLIFFIILVLGEVACRIFLPQWAPMTAERAHFWEFDELLGWRHTPNRKSNFKHPDFSVDVSINSQGLRDKEYPLERTSKKRLLVLGDSYGWGFGVNDNQVFTEIMEKKHNNWEVINASVSGYGTVQQYLYYREIGALYKPDIVLLLLYVNDFQDNVGTTQYWYSKPVISQSKDNNSKSNFYINEASLQPPSLKQKFDIYLLGNFYLGRAFYTAANYSTALISQLLNKPKHKTVYSENIDDIAATQFALELLINEIQKNGSKAVIIQIPLKKNEANAVDTICKQYQILCFHLNKIFKRGIKQNWHFPHDRHWNALGHKMAAESIDEFLQEKNIW